MKIISFSLGCLISLLLLGFNSSRSYSKNSPTAVSLLSIDDPAQDVIATEKEGYTWPLMGNINNIVVTPKTSQ